MLEDHTYNKQYVTCFWSINQSWMVPTIVSYYPTNQNFFLNSLKYFLAANFAVTPQTNRRIWYNTLIQFKIHSRRHRKSKAATRPHDKHDTWPWTSKWMAKCKWNKVIVTYTFGIWILFSLKVLFDSLFGQISKKLYNILF